MDDARPNKQSIWSRSLTHLFAHSPAHVTTWLKARGFFLKTCLVHSLRMLAALRAGPHRSSLLPRDVEKMSMHGQVV